MKRKSIPVETLPIRRAAVLPFVAFLLLAESATGQTVRSITPSSPDLGDVVSGATGISVFRVASGSGTITRVSGSGTRLSTGTSRPMVTIGCDEGKCSNKELNIRIGNIGSPSGRAGVLGNFTVTAGSATISAAPTGTNPVNFRIEGIRRGRSATFFVGADVPISGNDTAAATGNASSGFYVFVSVGRDVPTDGSTSGLAVARVLRPISVAAGTGLAFGRILRPTAGSGSVTVTASNGLRSFTGAGTAGLGSPAPTRATYTVSGEGGQAFSLSFPASFDLTGPGAPLTVSLTSTATNPVNLSSTPGSAGTFAFAIGGSFPLSATTATGLYQGSYAVTVQYE